jgi:putative DNA primase/helicase
VAYSPDAHHEVFDRVLSEALPDEEVRRYLQKAVGYSLTGSVDEELFFFIHGPMATSKSTMTEAIQAVFSDYARTASTSTFMKKRDQGNARPDIAELNGARFVLTSEASCEERFDAELLKSFVSGDRLTARFLYARNFEFHPVSKLWITGNSRPRADVVDAALFRRLREIPFVVQVPKSRQDPAIKRVMKDPAGCGPAILRWMVDGCLLWQRDGLHDPAAIVQAGQDYEAESNPLQEFFDARCVFGPDCVTFLREVYQAYTAWASSGGITPRFQVSEKRLAAILRARQCTFEQDSHGRFLRGVRVMMI